MRARSFLSLTLLVTSFVFAQAQEKPFEGIIVQKRLLSFSEAILQQEDFCTPGRDTIITYIKGDKVHCYNKVIGLHIIYADGKTYCYSENTQEGFSVPERFAKENNDAIKEIIETNETRSLLGHQCSVKKVLLLSNTQTVENECWLINNVYHLSATALLALFPDAEGQISLKSSSSTFLTGSYDAVSKFAKTLNTKEQREMVWGTVRKEATEISTSSISEVIEIKESPLDDSYFRPATNIYIKAYTIEDILKEPPFDAELFKKVYLATPGLTNAAKKDKNVEMVMNNQADLIKKSLRKMCSDPNYKTKGFVPKDLAKAERKSAEDIHQMNMNYEDTMYWVVFPIKLNQLLRRNNEYLKAHGRYANENIKPVAYDLDEEWDF